MRLLDGWGGLGQHRFREHPFGQVVDFLEARRAPGCQLASGEHPLQGTPAEATPFPPLAILTPGIHQLRCAQRASIADLREHSGDVAGVRGPPCLSASCIGRAVPRGTVLCHPPAEQRLLHRGEQRCGVPPVLEQLAARSGHGVEPADVVRAHPTERNHELRTLEDVDGVQLDHPDRVDHRTHPASVYP